MTPKALSREFLNKHGNYGLHIGRIFPNKRFIGVRFWLVTKSREIGFEKSIRIY